MVPFLSGEIARETVLLLVAFVLLPVTPAFISTLGVSTTKDERDLCFLFAGSIAPFEEATLSLLSGNNLFLIS